MAPIKINEKVGTRGAFKEMNGRNGRQLWAKSMLLGHSTTYCLVGGQFEQCVKLHRNKLIKQITFFNLFAYASPAGMFLAIKLLQSLH